MKNKITYRKFTFLCPVCQGDKLNVQTVTYKSAPVERIKWNGVSDEGVTHDGGKVVIDSWEEYYQCATCGEIFFSLDSLLATKNIILQHGNDETHDNS